MEKLGKPKKDYSHLLKSKYVKKWILKYKNPQSYLSVLEGYCNWLNKTPNEIIEKHNIAKKQINEYFQYLIIHGISHNSARQYCYSKLTAFFRTNNIPLEFDIIPPEKEIEKAWSNNDGIILRERKRETLKQIKSILSVRDQAIFLCKVSSAMDDIDLFNKRVRDFRNGYYEKLNICYFKGNRAINQAVYQTFISSEATDLVNFYLKERERITHKAINNSDWLFVSEKNRDKKIKATAFSTNLRHVTNRLGIIGVTPKSLRNWFELQLKINNIDIDIKNRLMGNKNREINPKEIYSDTKRFAIYYIENIEPFLTIVNDKLEKEIIQLRNEINKLKGAENNGK